MNGMAQGDGKITDEIHTELARRDPEEYNSTLAKVRSLIAQTKRAFTFRNEIARIDENNLRKGLIDEGSIHKIAHGCLRIFASRTSNPHQAYTSDS